MNPPRTPCASSVKRRCAREWLVPAVRVGPILLALWTGGARADTTVHACFDERSDSPDLRRSAKGEWTGAMHELVHQAFSRAGLKLTAHPLPWGRCQKQVEEFSGKAGQAELFFPASLSDERKRLFLASVPLQVKQNGVWYLRSRLGELPAMSRITDLNRYQLCGRLNHNHQWLRQHGLNVRDLGAPSLASALAKLELGRCDMALASREEVVDAETAGLLPANEDRRFMPYPQHGLVAHYLLWSRGAARAEAKLARVNAALAALRADGTAAAIFRRHGVSAQPLPVKLPAEAVR